MPWEDKLIYKDPTGKEHLFLYNNVMTDIVSGNIFLIVNKVVVFGFWRRSNQYSVGLLTHIISINPKVIKDYINMEDKKNKVLHNWYQYLSTALTNFYPNDIQLKITEKAYYKEEYDILVPNKDSVDFKDDSYDKDTVQRYFRKNYPDLNYMNVYNGYKLDEFVKTIKIVKK